ncbi:MAG: type transport system permease protein [Chloroflexota bacterium]|nr:type transport system permease protein [Chloroflexota bacterium]
MATSMPPPPRAFHLASLAPNHTPPLLGLLYTIFGGYQQSAAEGARVRNLRWLQRLPMAVVWGWFAVHADPAVATYLTIGAFFAVVWFEAVFVMGFSLTDEAWQGMIDVEITSPSGLMAVLFGKGLATAADAARTGLMSAAIVAVMSGLAISIPQPLTFVASLLVALIALIATSFVFAPLIVVVGGAAGFYNAIRPFGIVFGGFLFPISRLPDALQPISWFVPAAWSMNAMILTIQDGPLPDILLRWAAALALSVVYLCLAWWCFRIVERRVLVTGSSLTS